MPGLIADKSLALLMRLVKCFYFCHKIPLLNSKKRALCEMNT